MVRLTQRIIRRRLMKIRNYLKKKNYLMQLLLTIAGFV